MHFDSFKRVALGGAIAAATALTLATGQTVTAASPSFVLEVDTVSTHGCVQTNTFERGADAIVWRIAALKNGQEDKSAKVVVHVKNGQTFKAGWDNGFFAAAWFLPFNAPLGVVSYTVTATDGSLHATYTPPFLVPPSELMIEPYTYGVSVSVGKVGGSIPVSAQVTYTTVANGKATVHAVSGATVAAEVGLQGNVNAKGQLNSVRSATLKWNGKAWTGSIPTSGLKAGLYVVVVQAQDHVSPPNTGSGTSLAFNVK